MTFSFDLAGLPEGFADDPYPIYRRLREEAPVHPQANGSFILSRHADLDAVYRDTHRFISDKKAVFGPKYGVESPLFEHHTTSLVFNDPPLHTRVRSIMVGAMNPKALARMRPGLVALVDRLLDALAERQGPVDLVEDFAAAIPIEVIGNLFDIPHSQRGPLREWSLAILGALEPNLSDADMARGNRAVSEFKEFLRELVEERRCWPGEIETDVLTRLMQPGEGGLSEVELLQNCIFILNAGHETTSNLIGNAIAILADRPQLREALLREEDLLPSAVDEFLRFESPNQFGNRLTSETVEIAGVTIPAGRDLHLCIGAANRDEAKFPDADMFIPDRHPNRHLAFGGGAHTCVGLSLARMEGRIAIGRFLRRFPDFRLTRPPERSRRIRFRSLLSLHAELGPDFASI
ncbi:MAG: cytochrome P450 [Geminicoccaceae bacterium]